MISFSKKEDYSLIILTKLSENYKKRIISLSEISKEYNISLLFLRNLANELRKANILGAKEGRNGGYLLAKHPKKIKIKEVFDIFSKKPMLDCLGEKMNCPKKNFCHTSSSWKKISNEFLQKISRLNLYEFLNYK